MNTAQVIRSAIADITAAQDEINHGTVAVAMSRVRDAARILHALLDPVSDMEAELRILRAHVRDHEGQSYLQSITMPPRPSPAAWRHGGVI